MTQKFDRSRFKPTSLTTLKEKEEEVKEATGVGDYSSKRPGFLEVSAGSNKFRLYPGVDGDPFVVAKTICWLEILQETEEKDGKKKKEKKRVPVFNSKVHGGFKKDIVEEYVNTLKQYAEENIKDDDERKEYLEPLENWKTGLKYKTTWICYAEHIKGETSKFGRLELKPAVMKALNALASASDDPEDVIEVDPFTDPDEGRSIFITYDPDAKSNSDYYKVSIDLKRIRVLDDEKLAQLAEADKLTDIYENCFTKEDFQKQLDGIRNFDTENDFGIFELESFLDVVDEIKKQASKLSSKEDKKAEKTEKTESETEAPFKDDESEKVERAEVDKIEQPKRTSRLAALRERASQED